MVAATGLFVANQCPTPRHQFFWPVLDGITDLGVETHEVEEYVHALLLLMMTGKLETLLFEVKMRRKCFLAIVGSSSKVASMKMGFEDFMRKHQVEDYLRMLAQNKHLLSIIRIRMETKSHNTQPSSIFGTLWKKKPMSVFGTTWKKRSDVGDRVCFIQGCNRPLLLQPQQNSREGRQEYKVVGQFEWAEKDRVKQLLEDIKTGSPEDVCLS